MRGRLFLLLLLTSSLWAQSPYTITGTIQDASGNPASAGYVQFNLTPSGQGLLYYILNTTTIVPQSSKCSIITGGQLAKLNTPGQPCTLWGNDQISPANSLYKVTFAPNGSVGNVIQNVLISSTSTNLNNPTIISPPGNVVPPIITANPLTTMSLVPAVPDVYSVGTPTQRYQQITGNLFTNLRFHDFKLQQSTPPLPDTGFLRLYADQTSGNLLCLNETGGSCISSGGGGGGSITGVLTGPNSGLTGGGTTGTLNLSLLTTCSPGQTLAWNGTAWACTSSSSNSPFYYATSYQFAATATPDIVIGSNTETLASCPPGVKGNEGDYWVYLSGGTGTAEAVKVTGGTCVGDNNPGTLVFTAVNTHTGAWNITSASAGVQEASIVARYIPRSGFPATGGIVVGPNGNWNIYGQLTIKGWGQTVQFTGGLAQCWNATTPCLVVGDLTNSGATQDVTIIGFKGWPKVVNSQQPMVEVSAYKTRIINLGGMFDPSGGTFGYWVKVDDDQAFLIDGLSTTTGLGNVRCDNTFCGSIVYANGSFSSSPQITPVGWIKNSNFNLQCMADGIDWKPGNTLRISDTVIEGYPHFAIRYSGSTGGGGGLQMENVYEETGSCSVRGPTAIAGAVTGVIVQTNSPYANPSVSIRGGEGPQGAFPVFATGGGSTINYYVVAVTAGGFKSSPLLAGYAQPLNSGVSIPVKWYDIGSATQYDLLAIPSTGIGGAGTIPPYGTNNIAVATAITQASACVNGVCSFNDTQGARVSYTIGAVWLGTGQKFTPKLDMWPGAVILSPIGADIGNNPSATNNPYLYTDLLSSTNQYISAAGGVFPQIFAAACTPTGPGPQGYIWATCGSTSAFEQLKIAGGVTQGGQASLQNLKGILNMGNNAATNAPTHLITFFDNNPEISQAYGVARAPSNSNDAFVGFDCSPAVNTSCVSSNSSVGLSFGSSGSISNYIGSTGALLGTWLERLTSTNKTFQIPVFFPAGSSTAPSATFTGNSTSGFYNTLTGGPHQILSVVVSGPNGNQSITLTVSSPINPFSYLVNQNFQISNLPSPLTSLNGVTYTVGAGVTTGKPTATLPFTSTTSITPGTYPVTAGSTQTLGTAVAGHEMLFSRLRSSTPNAAAIGTIETALRDAWITRANINTDLALDTPLLRGTQVNPTNIPGAGTITVNGTISAGASSISVNKQVGADWVIATGDKISVGHNFGDLTQQVYTVTAPTTVVNGGTTSIPVTPTVLTGGLTNGDVVSPYQVITQVGDGPGAVIYGPLFGGLTGQPWELQGVKQPGTSLTALDPGYDFGLFVGSDNILHCQLSGGGNCAPSGGGSMVYPGGTGIPIVTSGTSWGTTLTAAAGDVIIGNATPAWSKIAVGTIGQQLSVGSTLPQWTGEADLTQYKYIACANTSTAQAEVCNLAPAVTAYSNGLEINVLPFAANTGADPTINVNSLGVKTIKKQGNVALVANDLLTTTIATLIYDGTNFELLNPQTNVGASGTVSPNAGNANAIAKYSAAGNSTVVGPDATFNDNGTTLTYSGTNVTFPPGSATACGICWSGLSNTGIGALSNSINIFSNNAGNSSPQIRFYRWNSSTYVLTGSLSMNQVSGSASGWNLIGSENANNQPGVIASKMGTSAGPIITLGGNGDSNGTDLKATAGNQNGIQLGTTAGTGLGALNFAPTSGTATFNALAIYPFINQTGGANGKVTDIFSNSTETALVGTHNLLDLQVGSASKFTVDRTGVIATGLGVTQSAGDNSTKLATTAYVDTRFVGTGTATMATASISSGTCATVVTVGATGVATTDVIIATPNVDPTGVTGYGPSASGSLYIQAYPTAGNVNFKVCNNTSASITPSALTLNWKVVR